MEPHAETLFDYEGRSIHQTVFANATGEALGTCNDFEGLLKAIKGLGVVHQRKVGS
jgi:hypothetical protein